MKMIFPIVALAAMLATGCAVIPINSVWKQADITIDGNDVEWANQEAVDCNEILLRARNDGQYLYLCLSTQARVVKTQVMGAFRQSLTIWLDPDNRRQKKLGLKVDYTPQEGGLPNPAEEWDFLESSVKSLTIVQAGDEGNTRAVEAGNKDIQWDARIDQGRLIAEMKFPLKAEPGAAAIGAQPGAVIGVGLETSPIDPKVADAVRGVRRGSATGATAAASGGSTYVAGGAMGGGRHRHGGGGLGPNSGHAESVPDRFEYWVAVKLAEQ